MSTSNASRRSAAPKRGGRRRNPRAEARPLRALWRWPLAVSSELRPRVVVDLERFLRRPLFLGDVLQIHADPPPGLETTAHRVDEHVGGLKVPRGHGVPVL